MNPGHNSAVDEWIVPPGCREPVSSLPLEIIDGWRVGSVKKGNVNYGFIGRIHLPERYNVFQSTEPVYHCKTITSVIYTFYTECLEIK